MSASLCFIFGVVILEILVVQKEAVNLLYAHVCSYDQHIPTSRTGDMAYFRPCNKMDAEFTR